MRTLCGDYLSDSALKLQRGHDFELLSFQGIAFVVLSFANLGQTQDETKQQDAGAEELQVAHALPPRAFLRRSTILPPRGMFFVHR